MKNYVANCFVKKILNKTVNPYVVP